MPYDNPAGIFAAALILELLAISAVALRFWTRYRKVVTTIASDWIILAALICASCLTAMELYGVTTRALGQPLSASGRDRADSQDRTMRARRIDFVFFVAGVFTLGLVKISVGFLYRQIFTKRIFRIIINVWIALLIGWTISFVFAAIFNCGVQRLARLGLPSEGGQTARCDGRTPMAWGMVISDVLTDLITLILPIPMIWSLQMPNSRKVGLLAIFLIGALSVGASIAKAYAYISASLGAAQRDGLLLITEISIWNLVEIQVGIIAACSIVLRPLLKDFSPRDSLLSLIRSLEHRLSRDTNSSTTRVAQPPHSSNRGRRSGGGSGSSRGSEKTDVTHVNEDFGLPTTSRFRSEEGLKTQIERDLESADASLVSVARPNQIYVGRQVTSVEEQV